jgi:hypothetical protein
MALHLPGRYRTWQTCGMPPPPPTHTHIHTKTYTLFITHLRSAHWKRSNVTECHCHLYGTPDVICFCIIICHKLYGYVYRMNLNIFIGVAKTLKNSCATVVQNSHELQFREWTQLLQLSGEVDWQWIHPGMLIKMWGLHVTVHNQIIFLMSFQAISGIKQDVSASPWDGNVDDYSDSYWLQVSSCTVQVFFCSAEAVWL